MIKVCNKIIEYAFYALFFLVPLVFTSTTSELFEFNKIWLTFALTIMIAAYWTAKSIFQKRIRIQRTPLDIPILLFLLSQIISTIFSLDQHVSLWGYYSRFNGGLLSILSYIFLYYAFVSNFAERGVTGAGDPHRVPATIPSSSRESEDIGWGKSPAGPRAMVLRLLKISLFSGLIVALWGLPSHFGYDPTCLIFRGTLDVSCWTEAFQPKVRIFSTLGQPNWLAAYLAILIPISIVMFIKNLKPLIKNDKKYHVLSIKNYVSKKEFILATLYFILTTLFYIDLLFTRSQSGFVGLWAGLLFFSFILFWRKLSTFNFQLSTLLILLSITFLIGQPISQLDKFTFNGIKNNFSQKTQKSQTSSQQPKPVGELGGTDSGTIRLLVWKGAIDIFKNNPVFGTGVETFAFAYYKHRPAAHNLVSEWDYLYNKAHNEYLNYLATTGAFGLGSYLLMIGGFLIISIKEILRLESRNLKLEKEAGKSKLENQSSNLKLQNLTSSFQPLVSIALISAYLSILVSNFFGFSVVIVNIYLFMIPAFVFVLNGMIDPQKSFSFPSREEIRDEKKEIRISSPQWISLSILLLVSFYLSLNLFRFREADKSYALGYNYDKSGDYQSGYSFLEKAVSQRNDEPMILDELSINNAVLAVSLLSQKDVQPQTASMASVLAQRAVQVSDQIVKEHPNNVVFWKTRTRLFYALSQIDRQYLPLALSSIQKAHELAPTDAKISYNLGLLYGQNGNGQKAIEQLKETIKLKPDYRDAYYALALFYKDLSMNKEAAETMRYILEKISPKDEQALQALKAWGEM